MRRRKSQPSDVQRRFWGEAVPAPASRIRAVEDPTAVVRSLGPPPLAGHEHVAEHYLAAVYEKAASRAGALGRAAGLFEAEDEPGS